MTPRSPAGITATTATTATAGTSTRAARPDRDLVAAVRAEVAAIEPARVCCRVAERAGLGSAATGRARTPTIGRLAVRLDDTRAVNGRPPEFDWASAAPHCRRAFLRGLFLARGSLSLSAAGTHLEFVVPRDELAPLTRVFADVGLPAQARMRRGRGVLTWKSAETVTSFLRLVGSTAATLEIESQFVTRSLRGQLNRAINAESANLRRSVVTARRQLAAIESLADAGELERLPAHVRRVAELRRREPEATFGEIAERLGVTRAVVQRAFEALETRALHLAEAPGSN